MSKGQYCNKAFCTLSASNFTHFLKFSQWPWNSMACDLWSLSFSRPWQARMAIQRTSVTAFCLHSYSFVINHLKTSWWSYLRSMVVVQLQLGPLIVVLGHVRTYKFTCALLLFNFSQKRWRAMRMVASCSDGRDAPTDVHTDLRSLLYIDLRSSELDLSGSRHMFRWV